MSEGRRQGNRSTDGDGSDVEERNADAQIGSVTRFLMNEWSQIIQISSSIDLSENGIVVHDDIPVWIVLFLSIAATKSPSSADVQTTFHGDEIAMSIDLFDRLSLRRSM